MSIPANSQTTQSDYYELMRKKSLLDANVHRTKEEIRNKRRHNAKVEHEIQKKKSIILKLDEDIQQCGLRQKRVTESLNGLHNLKTVLEKDKEKLLHQTIDMKEKFKKVESETRAIVVKYDKRRAEYLERYKQLRVYKRKEEIKAEVERNVIALKQVRHDFETHRKKFLLLNTISGQNMIQVITGFASQMVLRADLKRQISTLTDSNRKLVLEVEKLSNNYPLVRTEVVQKKVYNPKVFEAPSYAFPSIRERLNFGPSLVSSNGLDDLLQRFRSQKKIENAYSKKDALPNPKRLKMSEPMKETSLIPAKLDQSDATNKAVDIPSPEKTTPIAEKNSPEKATVSPAARLVCLPKKTTVENNAKVSLIKTANPLARIIPLPKKMNNAITMEKIQSQEDNQPQKEKDSFHKKTVTFSSIPNDDCSSISSSSAYQESLTHQKPESPKSECSSISYAPQNQEGPSVLFSSGFTQSGFSNPSATSTPANEDFGAFFGAQSSQKYSSSSFFNLF